MAPADRAPSSAPWRHRGDIEGLRAVAIVFVVLFHARLAGVTGGFLGVDVFFVLSGFLISGILIAEAEQTGTISLRRFWARRARRLLPAGMLIVLATLAIGWALESPYAQAEHAKTAQAFAAYSSNLLFARRANDYFGQGLATDPLLHTWSLSIEEQFYVVFAPLLLLLLHAVRSMNGPGLRRRFAVLAGVVGVVSFVACVLLVQRDQTAIFYQLPTRAWEFAIGGLTVAIAVRLAPRSGVIPSAAGILAIAALMACAFGMDEYTVHPGFPTLVPTLATAAILWIGTIAPTSVVPRFLATAPMRLVGALSYSWYLWHWPLLVFLLARYPDAPASVRFAVAFGSLIPAALAYRFVESPVRYSAWLQARSGLTIVGALTAAIVVFGIATMARVHGRSVSRAAPFARIERAREQNAALQDGCVGMHPPPPTALPANCVYGRGDTLVVLFGDSHAWQWFPTFEALTRSHDWRLITLARGGCPPLGVAIPERRPIMKEYTECERFRQASYAFIERDRPQLVVISYRDWPHILLDNRVASLDSSPAARARYGQEFRTMIGSVQRGASTVVLLRDTPMPGFDVPDCLELHLDSPGACDLTRSRVIHPTIHGVQSAALQGVPRVAYVDLNGSLCDATRCPAEVDGIVRYQDGSHISIAFATALAPVVDSAIQAGLRASRGARVQ